MKHIRPAFYIFAACAWSALGVSMDDGLTCAAGFSASFMFAWLAAETIINNKSKNNK